MSLRIFPIFIISFLFLASCGQKETTVVVLPSTKVVTQETTTPVFDNTGMTATGIIKYEIINGIEVPPEPDPVVNNATLAGIDVNENGVRDDVERKLAFITSSSLDFQSSIKYAQLYQKQFTDPTPADRDSALRIVSEMMCETDKSSKEIRLLRMGDLFLNTTSRENAMNKFNTILIGFDPEELLPCN